MLITAVKSFLTPTASARCKKLYQSDVRNPLQNISKNMCSFSFNTSVCIFTNIVKHHELILILNDSKTSKALRQL